MSEYERMLTGRILSMDGCQCSREHGRLLCARLNIVSYETDTKRKNEMTIKTITTAGKMYDAFKDMHDRMALFARIHNTGTYIKVSQDAAIDLVLDIEDTHDVELHVYGNIYAFIQTTVKLS